MICRFAVSFSLAIVCTFLVHLPQAFAAEAGGVEIEHQGKRVAGYTITWSGESDEDLIAGLYHQSLSLEPAYRSMTELAELETLRLEGDVAVKVYRRGTPTGTSVEIDGLTLIRDPAGNDRWSVPIAEVDRLMESAGIAAVSSGVSTGGDVLIHSSYVTFSPTPRFWIALTAFAVLTFCVIAAIAAVSIRKSSRSGRG